MPGVPGNPTDSYLATLEVESGSVAKVVHEHGNGLPRYLLDLAESWKGWEGAKTFESLEGELALSATHDGLGTVDLVVTLRQPWPPEWSATASLDLGSGADLEAVANAVSRWVDGG